MLEYDRNDLLGTGWRRTVHKSDESMVNDIMGDMTRGLAGHYQVRSVGRSGVRFMLRVVTFCAMGSGLMFGSATLLGWESGRTHYDMAHHHLLPDVEREKEEKSG